MPVFNLDDNLQSPFFAFIGDSISAALKESLAQNERQHGQAKPACHPFGSFPMKEGSPSQKCGSADNRPYVHPFADFARSAEPNPFNHCLFPRTKISPPFDVKETSTGYEIHVDVPGFERTDLNIELEDTETLVISGHNNKNTSSQHHDVSTSFNDKKESVADKDAEKPAEADSAMKSPKTPPPPSVSDLDEWEEASVPTESKTAKKAATENTTKKDSPPHSPSNKNTHCSNPGRHCDKRVSSHCNSGNSDKFLVNERVTGFFKRVVTFPNRVDDESLKASLKNGVLTIEVNKAAKPAIKKVVIN